MHGEMILATQEEANLWFLISVRDCGVKPGMCIHLYLRVQTHLCRPVLHPGHWYITSLR